MRCRDAEFEARINARQRLLPQGRPKQTKLHSARSRTTITPSCRSRQRSRTPMRRYANTKCCSKSRVRTSVFKKKDCRSPKRGSMPARRPSSTSSNRRRFWKTRSRWSPSSNGKTRSASPRAAAGRRRRATAWPATHSDRLAKSERRRARRIAAPPARRRAAEMNAAAESARIGVAESDLYPRLFLFGDIGVQASDVAKLFAPGSMFLTVGPSFRWSNSQLRPYRQQYPRVGLSCGSGHSVRSGCALRPPR